MPKGIADRLSMAADAKRALLERAARARAQADSPAAAEHRAARESVKVARHAVVSKSAHLIDLHQLNSLVMTL